MPDGCVVAEDSFPAYSGGFHVAVMYGEVSFGVYLGIRYVDGDCICRCFPIHDDDCSYLLVTAI